MNFTNKDGTLTAYALACGYIDMTPGTLSNGIPYTISLSDNGCTYDVQVSYEDKEWSPQDNRINGIFPGWAQTDKL